MAKTLEDKIAEDICEMNCWRTPKKMKKILGREFTKEEIQLVFDMLETYVPYKQWLKVWQKQDMGKAI